MSGKYYGNDDRRRSAESDDRRLRSLTREEVGRIVTAAAEHDPRLRPVVEQFEAERWHGFPKDHYRNLLLAGIKAGILEGVLV